MKAIKVTIIAHDDTWGAVSHRTESIMITFDIPEPQYHRNGDGFPLLCCTVADNGKALDWVKLHFPDAEIRIVDKQTQFNRF
jgi:hypothetical protein